MAKKAHSGPMTEMLNRLTSFTSGSMTEFRTVYFAEDMLLHAPIEEWPIVEVLIAFFSTGFPLHKAQAYTALRRPLVLNDLKKQEMLFDRRVTYRMLEEVGVPVPHYTVFNAEDAATTTVDEAEDYLEINSVRIQKPLVEKPISGEDHNIYIYYPRSHGGGSKRLFRKREDRSSQYYPDAHATRLHDGSSYIYEELLQTEGTDVKVYAVGVEYAHAEARKSPVVDGKVMRNARGREVRYPVILTGAEKEIARKVVLAFGQTLCGFDLLRSNGRSYVCDVNGWSFVKDSHKFWDDSANLFRQYCLEALAPSHLLLHPQPSSQLSPFPSPQYHAIVPGDSHAPIASHYALNMSSEALPQMLDSSAASGGGEVHDADGELLCVVAFTRHGDRTPKQKLKFITKEPGLLSLITEHSDNPREELRIKNIRLMEELMQRVEAIVERMCSAQASTDDPDTNDTLEKFIAVRQVLKSHPFHGINRKVQLKPTQWKAVEASPAAGPSPPRSPLPRSPRPSPPTQGTPLVGGAAVDVSDVSCGSSMHGSVGGSCHDGGSLSSAKLEEGASRERGTSTTLPGDLWEGSVGRGSPRGARSRRVITEVPTEAMFILKWGGELTQLGEAQSALLGTRFRNALYPGELSGVLRLHATYRHDLKIYSSDEGRVQMTAAAFTKGYLDLEGDLTPILASLVSKHTSITKMLDETPDEGRSAMDSSKAIIHRVLTSVNPLSSDDDLAFAMEELLKPPTDKVSPTKGAPSSAPLASSSGAAPAASATSPVNDLPPAVMSSGGVPALDLSPRDSLPIAVAGPPAASPTVSRAQSASSAVSPSDGYSTMARKSQAVPADAVSPLIEAITSVERGDCSLLRGAELSLRQLGNPREALHQLHQLVDNLTSELRARIEAHGLYSESSPSLQPTRNMPVHAQHVADLPAACSPAATIALERATRGFGVAEAPAADLAPADGGGSDPESTGSPGARRASWQPSNGETVLLHYGRWAKLKREFYKPKKGAFDTTKIPDLYDNAMYDMLHNQYLNLKALPALYATARALASYVVPQEYGAQPEDKVKIGINIGGPMLSKLRRDLLAGMETGSHEQERVHALDHAVLTDVRTPRRHVRTRLYFTSESHIHSLFNVLRWGSAADDGRPSIFSDAAHSRFHHIELGYLTHIVFRVLQKPASDPTEASSFRVQVLVSPGIQHHHIVCDAATASAQWQCASTHDGTEELLEALKATQPLVLASSADLTLDEMESFLSSVLAAQDEEDDDQAPTDVSRASSGPSAGASGGEGSRSGSACGVGSREPREARAANARRSSSSSRTAEASSAP